MSNKAIIKPIPNMICKNCGGKEFKRHGHTINKNKAERFSCLDCGATLLKSTQQHVFNKSVRKKRNAAWLYVWMHYGQSSIAKWLDISPPLLSYWLKIAGIKKSKQKKETLPEIRKVGYNIKGSITYQDITGKFGIFIDLDGGPAILFERER
jgi:transposase-like protein